MSDDALYRLLANVPADADRAILIYPDGNGTAVKWMGMSAEQVAEFLYRAGDLVVEQRIPLKPWKPPTGGE